MQIKKIAQHLFPYKLPIENFVKIYLPLIAILITATLTIFGIYLSYFKKENKVLFYLSDIYPIQKSDNSIYTNLKFTIFNNGKNVILIHGIEIYMNTGKALNTGVNRDLLFNKPPIHIENQKYKYMEINDLLIGHHSDIVSKKKEVTSKLTDFIDPKQRLNLSKELQLATESAKNLNIVYDETEKQFYIDINMKFSIIDTRETLNKQTIKIARLFFNNNNQLLHMAYGNCPIKLLYQRE